MSKFDEFKEKAKQIVQLAAELGDGFDVCIDENGGYIENDSLTIHFDADLNVTQTEISL